MVLENAAADARRRTAQAGRWSRSKWVCILLKKICRLSNDNDNAVN